ncbi:hypothetical protein [Glaciimonas sp. PAMC28666]|uniref:hypothetical protein n=1 Tax=Glaciimonas sp. PAMC28666 TaxID=2807626 RepID=UPI0019623AEF|nr:hypothetical protein [Glaciimonas sp. PAMC28666]QRX82634.1 hypothetical protein JQN73_21675 [Glaciimonas sp. PAMC28666]
MSEPTIPNSDQEAFHTAFSWLPLDHQTEQHAEFYGRTVDICRGIQTCLEVAHFSTLDRGTDAMPALNTIDTERLVRLALTSSQMLAEIAARNIDELKDKSARGSRKYEP